MQLAYLFGTEQYKPFNYVYDQEDEIVGKAMFDLWIKFAEHPFKRELVTNIVTQEGNITTARTVKWPKLNLKDPQALVIDLSHSDGIRVTDISDSKLLWSRCNIWDEEFKHRLKEAKPSHYFYVEIPWIREDHMSYLDYILNTKFGPILAIAEENATTSAIVLVVFGIFIGSIIPYFMERIWKLLSK